ncbi:MAG TPA: hypothetical protein VG738_01610 [Chitinophagaceae bacterium]|nr:hypothetical protein [Chitinophagaceae bacterium]
MNELLPYEMPLAGKLANAPAPPEERGWDAMRRMLEEEDEDKVIPPVNRGCRTASVLLLVGLIVLCGVIVLYEKHGTGNDFKTQQLTSDSSMAITGKPAEQAPANNRRLGNGNRDTIKNAVGNKVANHTTQIADAAAGASSKGTVKSYHVQKQGVRIINMSKNLAVNKRVVNITPHANDTAIVTTAPTPLANSPADSSLQPVETAPRATGDIQNNQGDTAKGHVIPLPAGTVRNKDSSRQVTLGEADNHEPKSLWFGAGIALQQLLPVDGQKTTPYNAEGRKSSLANYIPSAYFRVYHGKKFLQVEFKYGAPQYTKDVEYSKIPVSFDSTTGITISNTSRVKKTYYHQLPVSIHYTVLPNLSAGAGFVWNRFQNAVVEQQTEKSSGGAGSDSVLTSKIVTLNHDSATAFAKSYFQFMIEMQYTWKRFSLGARYSWGLQPYLTFTSPVTGLPQKERNASLNIFLRYELWQSKKK